MELSKEKIPFSWGPEHQSAFKQMKKEIVSTPVLAYYNPKKQTVLQTCLLQDEKPAYFASKALTDAEKGYVAIELESLAVAWAMEKFHHFLYASHFILEIDQKLCRLLVPIGRPERHHKTAKTTLVSDYKPVVCKKW